MIQILGIKRVLGIMLLLALNGALAAGIYFYYMPQNVKLTRDLRTVRAQVSDKQVQTERLRTEFQQIQEQKARFEVLTAAGFFSDQSRVVARQRIEAIKDFTHVLKARYDIQAAQIETGQQADEAGYVILNSPVTIDVDALDDVDFYNFVYWIENAFPGHVSVTSFKVQRLMDVNDATLRQIGNGVPAVLIKGTVTFNWRTMIPKPATPGTVAGG